MGTFSQKTDCLFIFRAVVNKNIGKPGPMKISAVVLARNEEKNIEDCLKSLNWCDEVLVIDDHSSDSTVSIAKQLKARVLKRPLNGDFATQHNFGLSKAKGEWVLFVDADERVTSVLKKEILQSIKVDEFKGFYLKRTDFFGGRQLKHGETAQVKLLRLGKRKAGRWHRKVHETWQIKGKIGVLDNPLLHYPHSTIADFLKGVNYYSTLHAQQFHSEKVKSGLFRIIFNPLGKFIHNYLLRLGFLDGTPGLIVAMMMSFHSFLARAKLYLLWKKRLNS
jgi:glycosyltransferase involved in cell wall biosynthesis